MYAACGANAHAGPAHRVLDRIIGMPTALYEQPLRRATLWVLAAWLCVLLAGVWSPVARAQASQGHLVYLCSGELAPLDAPSPLQAAHQEALPHHTLDCPLCLPALAPPPWVDLPAMAAVRTSRAAADGWGIARRHDSALPEARAPPLTRAT